MGSTDAVPGTEAIVPVLFFPPPNQAALTALKLKICVSEQHIAFVKVRPGMAGEAGQAEVKSERTPKDGPCTPIDVRVTFKAPPKNGTLLELLFEVKKEAPVDQTVKVAGTFEPGSVPGGKTEPLHATAEVNIVKVMPVFSCFFYMH